MNQPVESTVTINGRTERLPGTPTVTDLLHTLSITGRIAVELNRQVVPRSEFDQRHVQSGDRIEIVHAIGGG